MDKKQIEKIKKINVQISKILWDEINSAKNHLNLNERLNSVGRKKVNYTFVEASHKLGKYLKNKRNKIYEEGNIYKL